MKTVVFLFALFLFPSMSIAGDDADWLVEKMIGSTLEIIYVQAGEQATLTTVPAIQKELKRDITKQELIQLRDFWIESIKGLIDEDDLQKIISPVYRQNFTPSELSEIKRFYQTSTGKKVLEKNPEIMRQAEISAMAYVEGKMSNKEYEARLVSNFEKRLEEIFGERFHN